MLLFAPFFLLFIPGLPLLAVRAIKRDTYAMGGMRRAGFVRVAGIFCSRLPHTGVTGGAGLEEVLVWCFYHIFLDSISYFSSLA